MTIAHRVAPVEYPFPSKPGSISPDRKAFLLDDIPRLLAMRDATLVAHYYTDPDIQALAERTGGCVADSLEMARFGRDAKQQTLIVAGVKFMGETAKILSPEKQVMMPTLEATCSLDLGCPADQFIAFCDAHPERTVVVYANTSAAVKARADWVVTSSCAVDIVEHLDALGEPMIWAPDRHLGHYVAKQTGADLLLWQGECIVHDEFSAQALVQAKHLYPDAPVLVHPESPASVVDMADVVGSTSQLIKASQELPNERFIVATDKGIFYKMQQLSPNKTFIEAPTAGEGATCKSCARCPWMALNSLEAIYNSLLDGSDNSIEVDEEIARRATRSLDRMLDFTASR